MNRKTQRFIYLLYQCFYFNFVGDASKPIESPKQQHFKKSGALTPKSKDFRLKSKIAQKAGALGKTTVVKKKGGKAVLDIPEKLLGEFYYRCCD